MGNQLTFSGSGELDNGMECIIIIRKLDQMMVKLQHQSYSMTVTQ